MTALLYVFAAIAGGLNAVQAGANAGLGKALDNKLLAGMVVLSTSLALFTLLALVTGRLAWPAPGRLAAVPAWAWIGGLLGATFVLAQLYAAERMGAAVFMTIAVTAAVVTSLVLDHLGLVGFPVHPLGWGRAAGAGLIVAGLVLVAVF